MGHTSKRKKHKSGEMDILAGKRLRFLRDKNGFSQSQLGENLNISFQQVQKYERGLNRIPGAKLYRLAQLFKVPMEFFFEPVCNTHPTISDETLRHIGLNASEDVNESLLDEFYRHQQWIEQTLRNKVKTLYGIEQAQEHFKNIKSVSTRLILEMGRETLKHLAAPVNDVDFVKDFTNDQDD